MQFLELTTLLLSLTVAGCTPRALYVTAEHPASPDAAAGRLAGPPPALRPGVVEVTPPPRQPPAPPAHHDHRGHH